VELRLLVLEVLGEVDDHHSGQPGGGDVKCLAHGAGDVVDVLEQVGVLDDEHGHADDVGLLEGVGADRDRGDLAGDHHQRHRVVLRGGDPGDAVERPRAAGGEDHPGAAPAGARVAVGHVGGALLVAGQDVVDV